LVLKAVTKIIANWKECDFALLHLDLHPHNMIMKNSRVGAFIDLDSLMLGPINVMVGFSAFKLVRQAVCERISLPEIEPTELLGSYLDGVYRNLTKLEVDRTQISLFAYAEVCRRIALIFRLNLVDNNSLWNHVLDIQIRRLLEIEILFGPISSKR
jgi:hypothetical protein